MPRIRPHLLPHLPRFGPRTVTLPRPVAPLSLTLLQVARHLAALPFPRRVAVPVEGREALSPLCAPACAKEGGKVGWTRWALWGVS